ncbi:MAG: isochorismate synthase [Solirubrobacterales bacterium]
MSAQHSLVGALERLKLRLADRIGVAVDRAEQLGRSVVASATTEISLDLDLAACVFASRGAGAEDRYFVWEEPDNDGFALGGIGSAWAIDDVSAAERFGDTAARCVELMRDAVIDEELDGPAAGPVWLGGFAFSAGGGRAPQWQSLPPTLMVLPQVTLARSAGRASITANVVCGPHDDAQRLTATAMARPSALRVASIPMLDPDPIAGYEISSVASPHRYEQAVGEARDRIRSGDLEKVVLAREVEVRSPAPFRASAVFDGLRRGYPECYCFCVGTPDVAFVGASPELLVSREGARLSAVALAGSTRRSADPSVDDHLGERLLHNAKDLAEHEIVVQRIERALAPLSVWVTTAEGPGLIKVANIQHLATPIRAQLAEPLSTIELAGLLHPTPAVGGEPWEAAEPVMVELEALDRGWYAAPVGWMDSTEDGEFCVALRCALLEGRTAHCYAGVGVVRDSEPEAELAETEVKLQALLAVLAGA